MTSAVALQLREAATGGALLGLFSRLRSHWRLGADASLYLPSGKWSFTPSAPSGMSSVLVDPVEPEIKAKLPPKKTRFHNFKCFPDRLVNPTVAAITPVCAVVHC